MTAAGVFCVYVTVPDRTAGEQIARAVVEESLAACVNLLGPATSFFRWNHQTTVAQEFILVMKTNQSQLDALTQRVRALHPYECPCIVSWPVTGGWPDFLDWVRATGPQEKTE